MQMFTTHHDRLGGWTAAAVVISTVTLSGMPAHAHNALISCFDNGDNTVTCEAGYSDGAPSSGQLVRVLQTNKRLIVEAKFDKEGTYTFKKPDVAFYVEFVGDSSHVATFDGDDLVK